MRQKKQRKIEVVVGTLSTGSEVEVTEAAASPLKDGSRLGAEVEAVDEGTRARWGLEGGVRVVQVDPAGPAAAAGVRSGDVIAQLGFEKIRDVEHFTGIVNDLPADTLLPIRFFSDGQAVFRTIIIKD